MNPWLALLFLVIGYLVCLGGQWLDNRAGWRNTNDLPEYIPRTGAHVIQTTGLDPAWIPPPCTLDPAPLLQRGGDGEHPGRIG